MIYIVIIIAAVLVVAGLVLTSISGRRRLRLLSDPYIESLQRLIEKDYTGAFYKLQEAVKKSNAPTDAYLRLGQLLRERGEAARALQIHQSLTVKSNLTRREKQSLFMNLAEDYDHIGKPERAARLLESTVKQMNSKDPALYFALVKHYSRLEQTDKAYDNLRELKHLKAVDDRHIALFLTTRAERLLQNGDIKEAKKLLQKALKHDPECAPALFAAGTVDEQNEDVEGAIKKWTRAAHVSEDLAGKALLELERNLFDMGKFSDMERIYTEILESRSSDENVTIALAQFYKKQGRIDDSMAVLKEFLSWRPDSFKASLLLLSLYAKQEDIASVIEWTDDCVTRFGQKKIYACQSCHFQSEVMRWHCPVCNAFDSFIPRHES